MMKTIAFLALGCLTTTQAMGSGPAAASFDAKELITIADVGSGGTRLIMFMKTPDGVLQCCEETCSSENSPSVINLPGKSRYTGDTTLEKVEIFSKALFEDALVTLKEEAQTRCPKLYDEIKDDSDGQKFKEIITASSGVRILATAGARRNAVNDAIAKGRDIKAFNAVLVAGFQQMFKAEYDIEKPTHFADGSIMDGTYEAYFGLVEGFKTAKKHPGCRIPIKKRCLFRSRRRLATSRVVQRRTTSGRTFPTSIDHASQC